MSLPSTQAGALTPVMALKVTRLDEELGDGPSVGVVPREGARPATTTVLPATLQPKQEDGESRPARQLTQTPSPGADEGLCGSG